ncbi:MAG: alpha/beta hydrolase [Mycobacteriales bacterium]
MATIQVDGVDIFYKEQGHGSPLLLIHGAGGDAEIWGETFTSLAVAHRVIAYDRRGFRRSIAPAVTDYHRHGEDAAVLLGALNAAPATVVGWSGGGLTALDLVVHHPELVAALVLVEPPLHAKKHLTVQMATAFIKVQLLRRLRGERAAAETFFRFATSHTTGGCTFERMPTETREAMLDTATATMGDLDAGTGEYLTMAQIAAISCPVTCLLGDLTAPAIANATRRIVASLPNAKLVEISSAGHAMHFDQPQAFVDAVFVASAQVPDGG